MTTFLIGAVLLVAASLALLARPWWRRQRNEAASRQALNASIYRDQLAELESDRAGGELAESDYQEARAEIQRRLLEDAALNDAPLAAPAHPRRTLVAMAVALPLLAGGLYAWLGSPAALDPAARRDFSRQDVEDMVDKLAARMEREPDNLQGWMMLARSYKAMRRYDEAERAFEKGFALVEKDAQLLSDYADLLASKAGGFAGKPDEMIARALALDPEHVQARWLAGTAAFEREDYARAIEHWQRIAGHLTPESENARMLAGIIAEAREKLNAHQPAAGQAGRAAGGK